MKDKNKQKNGNQMIGLNINKKQKNNKYFY